MSTTSESLIPSLPQNLSDKEVEERSFQTSVSKASYNYMFSYLEPLSLSAGLPAGEDFTLEYDAKVVKVFIPLLENFKNVVLSLLERELEDDLPMEVMESVKAVEAAYNKFNHDDSSFSPLHLVKDFGEVKELVEALSQVPAAMEEAIQGLARLPKDLAKMVEGMGKVIKEFQAEGFTAFLKDSLYYTLDSERGREYLESRSLKDYESMFNTLPKPLSLTLEQKSWMIDKNEQNICSQDWYFGHMQIAGFNTTNLLGVVNEKGDATKGLLLSDLLAKMPVTDEILQKVSGDITATLSESANKGYLFACDYAAFAGAKGATLHELQRYPEAPIALFYWSASPPSGYPTSGALLPIAVQTGQTFDAEKTPIFTPNDCTQNNDGNGAKWQIAKAMVQNACTIQHEAVAHLGACHLVIEPIVVAANRQLPQDHPLMVLLKPHFRFTLKINNGAYTSLVVPGGVVASVISTSHHETGEAIVAAFEAWRFDEQFPDRLFTERGVAENSLPSFPFREDTLDLWSSITAFVGDYLTLYYAGSDAQEQNDKVINDFELQNWINEMVNPKYAAVKGMAGLVETGDAKAPYQINNFNYLVEVVSLIIYTASAQHASVNYAQYPLMSYIPAASGTLYKQAPGSSETLPEDALHTWLPPLDVAVYQTSFAYLLSSVQFDTLGYYTDDPRTFYFKDPRVAPVVTQFQLNLNKVEIEIHKRNERRPMPYLLQLPSMIPNSISI